MSGSWRLIVSWCASYADHRARSASPSRNQTSQKSELVALLLQKVVREDTEEYVSPLYDYAALIVKNCMEVRALALEVFIRRSYRTYDITEITSLADNDLARMQWIFSAPELLAGAPSQPMKVERKKSGGMVKAESMTWRTWALGPIWCVWDSEPSKQRLLLSSLVHQEWSTVNTFTCLKFL